MTLVPNGVSQALQHISSWIGAAPRGSQRSNISGGHLAHALRALSALTLAATALLPVPSASAADPAPAARIQVIVKSVYIWDDRDPFDGDMNLRGFIQCTAAPTSCFGHPTANVDHYDKHFSAGTGDTYGINAVLPQSMDRVHTSFAQSLDAGYSLFLGHRYMLKFLMHEGDDLTDDEDMGERHIMLQAENGWGIGEHSLRATRVDGWGDYTINFEVRLAPLAEIQPNSLNRTSPILVRELATGNRELVCMGILNYGVIDSGPFDVALRVQGVAQPIVRVPVTELASKSTRDLCVEVDIPDSGQIDLRMDVDEADAITEVSEINNWSTQRYIAPTGQTPSAPTASTTQPDLSVTGIRLLGQSKESQLECTSGKNDVVVTVQSEGGKSTGQFQLRLTLDNDSDDREEKTVAGLDGEKSLDVTFEDVRIKKGTHELHALADARESVDESDENNNARSVTVSCKDQKPEDK